MFNYIKKYKNHYITKYVLVLALVLLLYMLYSIYIWVNTQSTDNAYIEADISNISSEVGGVLNNVYVSDNTRVTKGDLIGEIDDRDYKARLSALDASINASSKSIEIIDKKIVISRINLEQVLQKLSSAQTNLDVTLVDYNRIKELNKEKFASGKTLDDAKNIYTKAKTGYNQAELDLEIAKQNLALLNLEKCAEQQNLKGLIENKKVVARSLQNTKIIAPVSGVLGNSSLELGNYISPGRVLFSIVQDETMYIKANFKETQIAKFRPGMKVRIKFDSTKGVIYGKIRSIAPATGSKFTLIPPDNATGNFTKIVQRVPVLIDFTIPKNTNLLPGMSVSVSVRIDY